MKKNILIIGGSSGIGRSLVDILEDEHNLFVASRSSESLANAAVTHLKHDVLNDELDVTTYPNNLTDLYIVLGALICARFAD